VLCVGVVIVRGDDGGTKTNIILIVPPLGASVLINDQEMFPNLQSFMLEKLRHNFIGPPWDKCVGRPQEMFSNFQSFAHILQVF